MKKFVTIIAQHESNGTIKPLKILWSDGRTFTIDRVLDIRQAASLKAGGWGIRYTCKVHGKEVYLFCDEGKWFIE
ncbi:hypothetical protein [Dendrosporobacter sp. 1207_IL3150]|uniref:hypothetical protein n=1 Tax=Dendrosporobacter sp. 1207_IL3150 TaxID=3084054 RepID=UPI002FD9663E